MLRQAAMREVAKGRDSANAQVTLFSSVLFVEPRCDLHKELKCRGVA